MIGGLGNDVYAVDNASDVVTEAAGQGLDAVATNLASYTLAANVEILVGGSNAGQMLTGNALANGIIGADGNDRINGGAGADELQGGLGADRFVFSRASDTATSARDLIDDFTHAERDLIDLSAIDAVAGGADNAFSIVASFTHHAGQLVIHTAETGHYVVLGDTNGDGTADFGIDVYSATALVAGDFVL
jgi:Ca2+-binding RTX toxin-like protein